MQASLPLLWLPLLMLAVLIAGAAGWWWHSRVLLRPAPGPLQEAVPTAQSTAQGSTTETPTAAGQPQAALVLGSVERKAYRLLREAFPRAEVLAHVQLLRFIRLPPREQREAWLQGVGGLDVDLLLCDSRFRVLAAVDVRTRRDTASGKERNERMAQVLQAAGITVHQWHEESLPTVAEIRATVAPALAARKARARAVEAAGAAAGALTGVEPIGFAVAALPAIAVRGDEAPAPAAPAPLHSMASTIERAALQGRSAGL